MTLTAGHRTDPEYVNLTSWASWRHAKCSPYVSLAGMHDTPDVYLFLYGTQIRVWSIGRSKGISQIIQPKT